MQLSERLARAEALIFDCDGTLVDSANVYASAWAEGFRACGHQMEADWYRARNGLSEHVLLDEFERQAGAPVDRRRVVAVMRQAYENALHDLEEVRVIATIAREYQGVLPLAVASGGPSALVRPSLRALGLDGLFDIIVTIEDVDAPKPAPDLFVEAARRLGVAANACVVFEDSSQGIAAARAAGCRWIDVADLL